MFQAEGVITIGGTDYSDDTIEFALIRRRNTVAKPATFGNIRETQKAGALIEEVRITALTSVVAASLARELFDAALTDSAELTFAGKFVDAAISADNPSISGTFLVIGSQIGGRVNQWNQQTWTFPVTDAGFAEDTSP